jgi:hypothetical protein
VAEETSFIRAAVGCPGKDQREKHELGKEEGQSQRMAEKTTEETDSCPGRPLPAHGTIIPE